jgi:hypothetical protein
MEHAAADFPVISATSTLFWVTAGLSSKTFASCCACRDETLFAEKTNSTASTTTANIRELDILPPFQPRRRRKSLRILRINGEQRAIGFEIAHREILPAGVIMSTGPIRRSYRLLRRRPNDD